MFIFLSDGPTDRRGARGRGSPRLTPQDDPIGSTSNVERDVLDNTNGTTLLGPLV